MSGGVDSSVAALLLKDAGYSVTGVTMKLYGDSQPAPDQQARGCCTLDDVEDARRVCHRLGIPHYVFNLQREFKAHVIDYFSSEYQRGRTPHPCIACNDRIKFSFLLQRAQFLGADYIATGHYARIGPSAGGLRLLRGLDPAKDQSYVLYGMGQGQLSRTLMPVGHYAKEEIRELAEQAGFPNARKPDSQDICFIPSGDYREYLRAHVDATPGPIVDHQGSVLGEHPGIQYFTVGQRRGLGVHGPSPQFVLDIDPDANRVTVGPEELLYRDTLRAGEVSYVSGREPGGPVDVTVKIRYKSQETDGTLYPEGDGALIEFRQPQRAVTPGQAAVFYAGDEVLGGGRICRDAGIGPR